MHAHQAYEWGLVNHVVHAGELLAKATSVAEEMCRCVPHILAQYKPLIDEGYCKPFDEALRWEEAASIESAKQAMAHMVAQRREAVLAQGRSEKE
ncbi:MAG: hypothetical protein ACR2PS_15670 [Pseudomonadales bacterium]